MAGGTAGRSLGLIHLGLCRRDYGKSYEKEKGCKETYAKTNDSTKKSFSTSFTEAYGQYEKRHEGWNDVWNGT